MFCCHRLCNGHSDAWIIRLVCALWLHLLMPCVNEASIHFGNSNWFCVSWMIQRIRSMPFGIRKCNFVRAITMILLKSWKHVYKILMTVSSSAHPTITFFSRKFACSLTVTLVWWQILVTLILTMSAPWDHDHAFEPYDQHWHAFLRFSVVICSSVIRH